MNVKPEVFIDLDGVWVDWTKGIAAHFGIPLEKARKANEDRKFHTLLPFSKNEMWRRLERAGRAFWSTLEEYPDTSAVIDEIVRAGYQPRILTSPTWDPSCYSGKAEWVQERFGKRFEGLILTREKFWLAGPNRILLDDSLENCHDWENHTLATPGGEAIHVPQWGLDRTGAWNALRERLRL